MLFRFIRNPIHNTLADIKTIHLLLPGPNFIVKDLP